MTQHASHPTIVSRLRRAEGHLKSVIAMIEAGRPCIELAQQLQAVEKAISEAKKTLVRDHVDHCLDAALEAGGGDRSELVREFKTITRYL